MSPAPYLIIIVLINVVLFVGWFRFKSLDRNKFHTYILKKIKKFLLLRFYFLFFLKNKKKKKMLAGLIELVS